MSIVISGLGLVTPLGWRNQSVWQRLCAGETGIQGTLPSPVSHKTHRCARVEGFDLDEIIRTPRVRRSSAISHFAVGAATLALQDAKLTPHPRLGVIVAVSIGGVCYTRSFHQEFIDGGARQASPMLFPETVFNAPASHIAAVFGLTDVNYTIIGDACSAANALAMAADLVRMGMLDQCLVIAAEELDWITLEGFAQFGLVSSARNGEGAMRPFDLRRNGFLGGEGGVAILLESGASAEARSAAPYARLRSCDRGFPFAHRRQMPQVLKTAIDEAMRSAHLQWSDVAGVVCSANGTFIDRIEADALARETAAANSLLPVTSLKGAVGESLAAGCLFQIAAGALAARHRQLPPTVGTRESILDGATLRLLTRVQPLAAGALLVLCVGFNEQVSVVVLGS